MELRLAHLAAGFTEEDVVVGVRVKRRIEINEIDALVREFAAVTQPLQVIAEVETVHCEEQQEIP